MIKFKNISKKFQLKNLSYLEVLNNFNLKIEKQELVLLKGESGCGKSTILNLCAALQKPNYGEIIVNNENISSLSDNFASSYRLKNIGFIFQKHNLFEHQSVLQNLCIVLLTSKYSLKEIQNKALCLLEKYDLLKLQDEDVNNLSGGQRARVAIIRALMNNPDIILADEPSSNLDIKLSNIFISQMHDLQKEGKTIIIATHDSLFEKTCKYSQIINLNKIY